MVQGELSRESKKIGWALGEIIRRMAIRICFPARQKQIKTSRGSNEDSQIEQPGAILADKPSLPR
jgi:hypothetical protein